MTTATLAEQAAAAMGDDGSKLIAPDGRTMDAVMEEFDATMVRDGDGTYKYIFDDASVITISDGLWDFGYQECNCWRTNGHSRYCVNGLGRDDWYQMYITPNAFTEDVARRIGNDELATEICEYFSDTAGFDAWVLLTRIDNADYPILAGFSNGSGCATTNGNCVWGQWCEHKYDDMLRLHDWGIDEEGNGVDLYIDADGIVHRDPR